MTLFISMSHLINDVSWLPVAKAANTKKNSILPKVEIDVLVSEVKSGINMYSSYRKGIKMKGNFNSKLTHVQFGIWTNYDNNDVTKSIDRNSFMDTITELFCS